MLNFPNNPTGYSPTMEELDRIATILEAEAQKGKKIIALCDDAYFGLFYEEETVKNPFLKPERLNFFSTNKG